MQFRLPIVLALILAAWAALAQESPVPEPAEASELKVPAEANALLDKVAAYYKSLDALSVEVITEVAVTHEQLNETMHANHHIAAKRPNLLSVQLKTDGNGATVVNDGTNEFILIPARKEWIDGPATPSFDEMPGARGFSSMDVGVVFVERLLGADPKSNLLDTMEEVEFQGAVEVDGVPCARIAMKELDMEWHLYFADGEKPWLMKLEPVVAAEPGVTIKPLITYKNWQANPELAADAFKFTPPADAKKYIPEERAASGVMNLKGKPAPDFKIANYDGGEATLAQHKDKDIVLLDFWATWCGPCRTSLPKISDLAAEYKDKGVVVYAVNVAETAEDVKAFLDEVELKLLILMDEKDDVSRAYGIEAFPTTVIIGRDGNVKAIFEGVSPSLEAELKAVIEEQLAEKKPAEATS